MASLVGTGTLHPEWKGEKASGFPVCGGGSGAGCGSQECDYLSLGVQALKQQLPLPRGSAACWKHPCCPMSH